MNKKQKTSYEGCDSRRPISSFPEGDVGAGQTSAVRHNLCIICRLFMIISFLGDWL